MEPGEFFVFTVTVLGAALVALLMLTSAYKRRLEFNLRKLELETQANALHAPVDDRTDLLEDRVRVLERIATDRGPDIAREIEALRGLEEMS